GPQHPAAGDLRARARSRRPEAGGGRRGRGARQALRFGTVGPVHQRSPRRHSEARRSAGEPRMKRLSVAILSCTALLLLSAPRPASGATYVVRGTDEATLLIPAGVQVEPYENAGYTLEVDDSTARIRSSAEPLESRQ